MEPASARLHLPPSPLQRLDLPIAAAADVSLYCKRDDLLTLWPGMALQGNKVRKLLPTLEQIAERWERPPLVYSFGGAYSNHVAALAVASAYFGLRAAVFIRGQEVDNPLLWFAARSGVELIRLSRSEYRKREDFDWLGEKRLALARRYDLPTEDVWRIPEGGTTWDGMISAGAAIQETKEQLGLDPDFFCLSAGTGGTAAGIIHAATPATRVEVFPALKGDWMAKEIGKYVYPTSSRNWTCIPGYHFGGYGKFPAKWIVPARGLAKRANIGVAGLPPLEPIYTAKLFHGVLDRIKRGVYPAGSRIVVLHTGGIY